MFDDLLAKKVLSMELNVLNSHRWSPSTASCPNCRLAAHQQAPPLEELEGEFLMEFLMSLSKESQDQSSPDQGEQDAPAARPESVRSLSYEPTEPIDDLP